MFRLLTLAAISMALLYVSLAKAVPCGNLPCNSPFFHAPYNAANLLKTYERVLKTSSADEQNGQVMEDIIWPLEGAGVQVLLTSDGGMTHAQRVQILNDYGFWLYQQGGTAADAVAVLQLVVKLDPRRAVAWLNLGDAYVSALGVHDNPFFRDGSSVKLPTRLTWADGQVLNDKAIDAYHHYLSLGGAPAQHVRDFLALNQINAPQGDVCAFVAAYADAGRLEELGISGNGPIDLVGDGNRYYVYSIANGTAHIPGLLAFTTPQTDVGDDYAGQEKANTEIFSPFNVIKGIGGATQGVNPDDDLFLIAFKSKYYALDLNYSDANDAVYTAQHNSLPTISRYAVAEITVVQPNRGVICTFTPKISPILVLNTNIVLCDRFLSGAPFGQPARDMSLSDQNIMLGPRGPGADYDLTSTAAADLRNNGHPLQIAYYDFDSGAGAGCDQQGITLFDPVTKAEKPGPLDDALRRLPIDCDGGKEYVITWNGRTYLELDHSPKTQPGEARGAGIYEVKDDNVYPVCIIANRFTYTINRG